MAESSETLKADEEEDELSDVPTKDVPVGVAPADGPAQEVDVQQEAVGAAAGRTGSAVMYIDFSTPGRLTSIGQLVAENGRTQTFIVTVAVLPGREIFSQTENVCWHRKQVFVIDFENYELSTVVRLQQRDQILTQSSTEVEANAWKMLFFLH